MDKRNTKSYNKYTKSWYSASSRIKYLQKNSRTQINWYNLVSLYPSASVLWDVFMAILLSCVDQFVPRINLSSKSSRGHSTKVSRKIRKCLSKKRSLWKRLHTERFDTVIHTKYRECCFKYKSLIQQHELRTEKRVIDATSTNLSISAFMTDLMLAYLLILIIPSL